MKDKVGLAEAGQLALVDGGQQIRQPHYKALPDVASLGVARWLVEHRVANQV